MKKAKLYTISGRVQGVGFRYYTQKIANQIGIYGYVKNLFNGNVESYAIGSEEQLKIFKSYLQKGPSYSAVDQVIEQESVVHLKYQNFRIT